MDEWDERIPRFSEAAFRELYDQTLAEVLRVARGICGDRADAEEAAQDAYAALARYWSEGRLQGPPRGLLFRVLQRSAVDALRRRRRNERRIPMDEAMSAPHGVAGPLRRALRRLQPQDAALLVTHTVVGMRYEELAAMQRTSVSALRSRLYRIRRELTRRYEEEGGEW